jgi:fused signal recognition particle receptor
VGFLRRRATRCCRCRRRRSISAATRPFVLLIIGVNGSGKTTTIGKLASRLAADGKKVLLAAGDTFRAAAVEQLDVWAKRSSTTLVRGKEARTRRRSSSRRQARRDRGFDVAIADTAGRLHTKTDLMQELQKVAAWSPRRARARPTRPGWSSTRPAARTRSRRRRSSRRPWRYRDRADEAGWNREGRRHPGITDQLKIPVRYIGVGEKVEDLRLRPDEFVDALFESPEHSTGAVS